MIYVASPYTTDDPAELEFRISAVAGITAALLAINLPAFSPIVYGTAIRAFVDEARRSGENILGPLREDAEAWEKLNNDVLSKCDCMVEVLLPGWEESKGMQDERMMATIMNIPIYKLDCTTKPPSVNQLKLAAKAIRTLTRERLTVNY